ncbi:NUDIX domain-containing protein [Vibrio sp. Of7-15]|uniref:NUDIX hydrolase n=1 Tax=Vibrio sp. Of7-15 TaxID=2724879 RepID=UPI001EF31AFF|nr:NUDIX domain-containing protein [Vibrio sp. Of7-15]MCG7499226.1 NUDIX domain-containing protein [Vibrio sp. Of7-15]
MKINTSFVAGVALAFFNHQPKMLLLKRAKESYWCHIAGEIESEETGWQALLREVNEETQISVHKLYNGDYLEQFYDPHQNQIMMIPCFVLFCSADPRVILNEEHTDYKWCTLEEAKALAPFPNQHDLYDHIWRYFVLKTPPSYLNITL